MKSDGPAIFRTLLEGRPHCMCGVCDEAASVHGSVYMLGLSVTLLDDPAVAPYLGGATRSGARLLDSEASFFIDTIGRIT